MKSARSNFLSSLIAVTFMLLPAGVASQECTMRLSDLQVATEEFTESVSAAASDLAAMFDEFEALERQSTAQTDQCPSGIDTSRQVVIGLDAGALVDRGFLLLDCGLFFSERVLADMAAAETANDSQLLLRLGEIQTRVFSVQQHATDASVEATFLGLRAQRLIDEHDSLQNRCSILSTIYD